MRNQISNYQGDGIGLEFFSSRQVSEIIGVVSPVAWVSEPVGGVSPVGWVSQPEITLIDEALNDYEVVWAAAGHPHAVYPTSYDELINCTDATPMVVGD